MALTPQSMVEISKTTNAAALANSEAVAQFRASLDASIKLSLTYPKEIKKSVEDLAKPVQLIWTEGQAPYHDHPIIYCLREIHRTLAHRNFNIYTTNLKTFMIGASFREISKYSANPSVCFQVDYSEPKDLARFSLKAAENIAATLLGKIKKNRKIRQERDKITEPKKLKRYNDYKELMKDVNNLAGGMRIFPEAGQCNVLIFEDSAYNYGEDEWLKIFEKTGAQVAYGYGLFPLELLFEEFPGHGEYIFRRIDGGRACVTFAGGHCNGYTHDFKKWATIYRSPFIAKAGYDFALEIEITCRTGPFLSFSVSRVNKNSKPPVRSIALKPHEEYYKVLDLTASYNKHFSKFSKNLVYFTVKASYVFETISFLASIATSSALQVQQVQSYVRKRKRGVATINTEVIAPWNIKDKYIIPFANLIYIYFKLCQIEEEDLLGENCENSTNYMSWFETFISKIKNSGHNYLAKILSKFSDVKNFKHDTEIRELMLIECETEKFQAPKNFINQLFKSNTKQDFTFDLYGDFGIDENLPDCHICLENPYDLGEQILECNYKGVTTHEFAMTDDDLAKLRSSLMVSDDSPFVKLMSETRDLLPKASFSHKCEVVYISAGPGCGKSQYIRTIAEEGSLVLAPFVKLAVDYSEKNQLGFNKFNFKTQHRALSTVGCKTIFVDEFTAYDYRLLAITVYKNMPDRVYLVGDDKQTKIMPEEGVYIGNKINLSEITTHNLLKNFRNPPLTVAFLNKNFGYKMLSARIGELERDTELFKIKTFEENSKTKEDDTEFHRLAFSTSVAKNLIENENSTVRASQGSTHKSVKLLVTEHDNNLLTVESLVIVGLSRHTKQLQILHDDSIPAKTFTAQFDLKGSDVLDNYDEFFPKPPEIKEKEIVLEQELPIEISCQENTLKIISAKNDESNTEIYEEKLLEISKFLGLDFEIDRPESGTKEENFKRVDFLKLLTRLFDEKFPKLKTQHENLFNLLVIESDKFESEFSKVLKEVLGVIIHMPNEEKEKFKQIYTTFYEKLERPNVFGNLDYDIKRFLDHFEAKSKVESLKVCYMNSKSTKPKGYCGKSESYYLGKKFKIPENSDLCVIIETNSLEEQIRLQGEKIEFAVPLVFKNIDLNVLCRLLDRTKFKFIPVCNAFCVLQFKFQKDTPKVNLTCVREIVKALNATEGGIHTTFANSEILENFSCNMESTIYTSNFLSSLNNLFATKVITPKLDFDFYYQFQEEKIETTVGRLFPLVEGMTGLANFLLNLNSDDNHCKFYIVMRVKEGTQILNLYSKKILVDKRTWVLDEVTKIVRSIPVVFRSGFVFDIRKILSYVGMEVEDFHKVVDSKGFVERKPVFGDLIDEIHSEIEIFKTDLDVLDKKEFEGLKKAKFLSSGKQSVGFMNRSGNKLFEIMCIDKEIRRSGKVLDLCGAPGGMSQALMTICNNATISTFSGKRPQDLEYSLKPGRFGSNELNIINCSNNNDVLGDYEKRYLTKKSYDLVIADGGTETKFHEEVETNYPIWHAEIEIALKTLKKGSSFILKLLQPGNPVCFRIHESLFKKFRKSYLYKPCASNPMSSEYYFVGVGFKETFKSTQIEENRLKILKDQYSAFNYFFGRDKNFKEYTTCEKLASTGDIKEEFEIYKNFDNEVLARVQDGSECHQQLDLNTPAIESYFKVLDQSLPETVEPTIASHPTMDAYLTIDEHAASVAVDPEISSNNLITSQILNDNRAKMQIKTDEFLCPTNARGRQIRNKKFRSFGAGIGNHFSDGKPAQAFNVLAKRYLAQPKSIPKSENGKAFARYLVESYFNKNVAVEIAKEVLADEEWMNSIISSWFSDSEMKRYKLRYEGSGGGDSEEGRKVRFTVKQIFKPSTNLDTVWKVGQGISMWSVQTNMTFCCISRVIGALVEKTEKNFILTDSYKPTVDFIVKLKQVFGTIPSTANFAVTDATMFDAYQNWFTQEIEKHYYRLLGINENFIDWYYSFRSEYFIQHKSVQGEAGYQKTSGEPLTLVNNGVVSKVISFNLFESEGPYAIVYKGDDYAKLAMNLQMNQCIADRIEQFCNLQLKTQITKAADFCGLAVVEGDIVPNVRRVVSKITGHRFRDYEHFCEYQKSLRDFQNFVTKLDKDSVLAKNAMLNCCSFKQMEDLFDLICSISHIDEKQYYEKTNEYEEPAYFSYVDDGEINICEV